MREEIREGCLSVVGGEVGGESRVRDVKESQGSLVPLWGNDEGRLEFGVGERAAKRSEVFERGGEEKAMQVFDSFMQAWVWVREAEEVSTAEDFWESHEAGGPPRGW